MTALVVLAATEAGHNPVTIDAAMITAVGVATGAILTALLGGVVALVRLFREPVKPDLLARVEQLETRVTGIVRHYHQQQVKAAAAGYVLEPLPAELLS